MKGDKTSKLEYLYKYRDFCMSVDKMIPYLAVDTVSEVSGNSENMHAV